MYETSNRTSADPLVPHRIKAFGDWEDIAPWAEKGVVSTQAVMVTVGMCVSTLAMWWTHVYEIS